MDEFTYNLTICAKDLRDGIPADLEFQMDRFSDFYGDFLSHVNRNATFCIGDVTRSGEKWEEHVVAVVWANRHKRLSVNLKVDTSLIMWRPGRIAEELAELVERANILCRDYIRSYGVRKTYRFSKNFAAVNNSLFDINDYFEEGLEVESEEPRSVAQQKRNTGAIESPPTKKTKKEKQ